MAERFAIKQGDRKPYLRAALKDANNNAIDLTGCSVALVMRKGFDQPAKVNGACEIVNPTGGIVEYQWADGDTSVSGDYMAEFHITYSDGTKLSVPNSGYFVVQVLRTLS